MDRSPRLAELVVHLTGCDAQLALDAVALSTAKSPDSVDDALTVVARAINLVHKVDLRVSVDLRESNQVHSQ